MIGSSLWQPQASVGNLLPAPCQRFRLASRECQAAALGSTRRARCRFRIWFASPWC